MAINRLFISAASVGFLREAEMISVATVTSNFESADIDLGLVEFSKLLVANLNDDCFASKLIDTQKIVTLRLN